MIMIYYVGRLGKPMYSCLGMITHYKPILKVSLVTYDQKLIHCEGKHKRVMHSVKMAFEGLLDILVTSCRVNDEDEDVEYMDTLEENIYLLYISIPSILNSNRWFAMNYT